MSSVSVYLLFLTVTVAVFVQCSAQFPPKDDDVKVCKENAGEREYVDASKDKPHNCQVTCKYTEGDEIMKSKDGQPCCDTGIMYTGRCKEGKCPPGNVQG